jgi:hypothetical protein
MIRLSVVEVVEHSEGNREIERRLRGKRRAPHASVDEPSAPAVARARGLNVFLAGVESDVIRLRKELDELARSAADVHDAVSRTGPNIPLDELGPGAGPADKACEQTKNRWKLEDRADTAEGFYHDASLSAAIRGSLSAGNGIPAGAASNETRVEWIRRGTLASGTSAGLPRCLPGSPRKLR